MQLEVTIHEITFQRNKFSGAWRATCSCGQCRTGREAEVKSWAACHDLDAKAPAFVSGQPTEA